MKEPEKAVQSVGLNRTGEKIGWIGGWTGGFCWVFAIAVIMLFQGAMIAAFSGVAVFLLAEVLIVRLAPWRYPKTRYYLLMLPIYVLFLLSVVWAVWIFGGLQQAGLHYWNFLWIFPCLSPLITIGARRWQDHAVPVNQQEKETTR